MIRFGYVGQNTLLPSASKTFRIANYSEERMLETTKSNLLALQNILEWNMHHKIYLFRITSHLVPYGSSPINSGSWKKIFQHEFEKIGEYIKKNGMRASMHPGQYTVLNSLVPKYYNNSLNDLEYHRTIFDLMELGREHCIVIHGGGKYDDKHKFTEILIERIEKLPLNIKNRLALENDETSFTAKDILGICKKTNVPGIIDVFHHEINPSFDATDIKEIISFFRKSWKNERQKIHYSNQDPIGKKGAHSSTIDIKQFGHFYDQIKDLELDIMLEVKDKQESVLRTRKTFGDIK